jgi:hypothetical protein
MMALSRRSPAQASPLRNLEPREGAWFSGVGEGLPLWAPLIFMTFGP